MLIDRRVISQFDFILFGLCLFICTVGLTVLYSAGFDPDRISFSISWLAGLEIHSQAFAKQSVFIGLGLIGMLIAMSIPPQYYFRLAYIVYGMCIVLLILVDVVGAIAKGSQRWLVLGPINIQPAEPTKLALILAMARYLSRNPPRIGGYTFKEIIIPGLIFGVPAGLIMGQPDLGTALVVTAVGGGMLLFAGVRVKVLVMLTVPVLLAIYPAWISLHDYQKRRIQVLFDPESDPRGSGYHINQSKIAVGSGSVFGKGYMQGTQTQLEFLPEHTTDFIFSVLAEEWGFVGSIGVLVLYLVFLFRLLRIVNRTKDLFFTCVCFGVTTLLFIHTLVNIGMVVGLLPVVGLPLPLFSYGGSSMVSCLFSLGMVLGLDMRRLTFRSRS